MPRLRRLRLGLLAQIGLALALVGTVPLAIAAVQLATVNREALVEQLLRTHTVSARTAADAIDSFLAARRSLAETLLLSPEFVADPTSEIGQARLRDSLASWSAAGVVAAALYDTSDQLIVKVQQKGYGPLADDLLGGAAAGRGTARRCAASTSIPGSASTLRSPERADRSPRLPSTARRCSGRSPRTSSETRRSCCSSIATARPLLGPADEIADLPAPLLESALSARLSGSGRFRDRAEPRDRRRLVGRRLRTMDRGLDAAGGDRRGGGAAHAAAVRSSPLCWRSRSRRRSRSSPIALWCGRCAPCSPRSGGWPASRANRRGAPRWPS